MPAARFPSVAEQRPPLRRGPPVLRAHSVLACPPHYPGESPGLRRLKIRARRPSPSGRRVGTRINRFEACSGFTLVGPTSLPAFPWKTVVRAARPCTVASAQPTRSYGGVPSTPPAGLSPARTRRLCTAHYQVRGFSCCIDTAQRRHVENG